MPDSSSHDPAESTRPVVPRGPSLGPGDNETLAVESELVEILDAYLAELTAGQAPSRDELMARHPQLATRLEACLAGLEFIHRAGSTGSDAPPQLGDFRLLREVGRGGMGAVYEAEQRSLGRRVAVKVLRFGTVSDPAAIDRFRREAETVAHLHHTNIVPIFFVGSDAGVNYYAMQFIEGSSLADVLTERAAAIEPMTVIDWGLQAAEALAHAHQRGVIHRDVKPSNLLLDASQRIWLTDFGLAKRLDDVTLSMTGALLGTPRYMSPEQASAARHQLDHRTDIYSLGATLYELVTGQPVFSADKPYQIIGQILHQEPTPPRRWVPALPRDLETILLKCLAKEPSQRYPSARALADDLRAVLEGRPIKARRAGIAERSLKWGRRHQRSLKLAGTTVAATISAMLLAGLAFTWYGRSQLAYVTLATDRPPLTADIRDASGHLVARETVPTEELLAMPAGAYRLQVSGENRLSESYDVHLRRGAYPKLEFNLDEALLMPPVECDQSYRLVAADGGAMAVVLDDEGLRCWDARRASLRWTMSLSGAQQPLLRETAGWFWPWYRLLTHSPHRGWGPYDLRPWMASPAVDLNGDTVADLVLAHRHQACLLAISGVDGNLLWVAARGHDLAQPLSTTQARAEQGVVSGVVAEPTAAGDLDGDGVTDYVVAWADEHSSGNSVARWLEAVSGATGTAIWQRELEEHWFAQEAGGPIAEPFRWFRGSGGASSWIGGTESALGGQIVCRRPGRMERTGYFHRMMSRPMFLSEQVGSSVTRRIGVLAASHLLRFDPATGEPVGEALDCGLQPGRPPLVTDVDGDGSDELVLLQELTVGPVTPARARVGVLSLLQRKLLWTRDIIANWPCSERPLLPAPQWPVVADLEHDGRREIILPNGTSANAPFMDDAWGVLEVVDGSTGKVRWQRRLRTMDQQVDHFLAGPDVDGDGCDEVFAATLWSSNVDLYVDALSGRDGASVWVGRHALRKLNESARYHLTPPRWWPAGRDGWPQLVVPAYPGDRTETPPRVCAFSAGTGELTCVGSNLTEFEVLEADDDDIPDLFAFVSRAASSLDGGGSLLGFRGPSREQWKSIDAPWSATADLNADGTRDLMRAWADGQIEAVSGRSRQRLWTTQLPEPSSTLWHVTVAAARTDAFVGPIALADDFLAEAPALPIARAPHAGSELRSTVPLPNDWDGDGTIDLLAYAVNTTKDRPFAPLLALSGRTGTRLWSAAVSVRTIGQVQALDVRDLDGDGLAEVIWIAASDWGDANSRTVDTHNQQLQLAVFSGRDGRLVWKEPLTKRFGLTAQRNPMPYDVQAGWVPVGYGDLDHDGSLDLLVPGQPQGDGGADQLELRVLEGKTGRRLWQTSLPPCRDVGKAFSDLPPCLVTDLDGDGPAEVVLLTFTGQAGDVAVLSALEGSDGAPRWSCQFSVPAACGRLSNDPLRVRYRPRPLGLRTTAGPPLICLNLWDGPERVVVVDATGQTVTDFRLSTERGYHRGDFRVWACDTDGDGNDELLLTQRDQLMAIRPDSPDQAVWQRPTTHLWTDEIEGILPARDAHPQCVVVRRVDSPGAVYALDAASGQSVWTAPAPTPRREGHNRTLEPGQIAVLSDMGRAHPAWLFFQQEFIASVREARVSATDRGAVPQAIAQAHDPSLGSRQPACVDGGQDDPRRRRPLPWNLSAQMPAGAQLGFLTACAWVAFYSLGLLYIPGRYLLSLIHRRDWSLRRFLLLPAVAAAPVMAVLIDAPEIPMDPSTTKFALAAAGLPVVWAVIRLTRWLVQGHRQPVALWLATSIVISVMLAVVSLAKAQADPRKALLPGEHYRGDGWYLIWYSGAYATAWLLLFSRGVVGGGRRVMAWRRRHATRTSDA